MARRAICCAEVVIETPVNLTREQKDLLEQFARTMEDGGKRHTRNTAAGWMG